MGRTDPSSSILGRLGCRQGWNLSCIECFGDWILKNWTGLVNLSLMRPARVEKIFLKRPVFSPIFSGGVKKPPRLKPSRSLAAD